MKFALQKGNQVRQNKVEASSCKEEGGSCLHTGEWSGGPREGDRKEKAGTDRKDVHSKMNPNRSTQRTLRAYYKGG